MSIELCVLGVFCLICGGVVFSYSFIDFSCKRNLSAHLPDKICYFQLMLFLKLHVSKLL